MRTKAIAIAMLAWSITSTASMAGEVGAKEKLERVLTCERGAKPTEVVRLIEAIGGLPIVKSTNDPNNAEYTIPSAIELFGRPVTRLSVHSAKEADGTYWEYGSVFSGESIDTVARLAGATRDSKFGYRKEIGGNDLLLREELGVTYLTCTNDVRTFLKSVRRTLGITP